VFNGEYACVVPYATPGTSLTEKISDVVTANESFSNLFLLQNHGIICCGNSIEEVVAMTEICEKAAEVFIGVKAIGYPITLTTEQIREIQEHDGEIYRHDSIRGH
jgi:ribulose-5-phosphate 4-epimerase/fuculose-1-phosphate aldolase